MRNDRRIGEVACPVYLFHGAHDDIIPYDHSVRLERLILSPHRLIRIEGSGHNDLSDFGTFDRELYQILRLPVPDRFTSPSPRSSPRRTAG